MGDQINQIQASYDTKEDRILLKFKTLNQSVFLAWMTRRYAKLLLPVLQGQHPTSGQSLLEKRQHLEEQMKHQQATHSGDYSSAYEEPDTPEYPLGDEPILLTQISFKNLNSDSPTFIMEPEHGAGLVLPYKGELLGPLLKIVAGAIKKADWELETDSLLHLPEDSAVH